MHSLIYLNLQFTAIFSHDFHLQYKARVALDFPLHHLPFSPSSYRKKKKKKPWDIKETTKNWFNWRIYEKNTKKGSDYFFTYIFYSSNMHSEQQSNLSFIKRSCRLSLSYVVLSKTSTSIVPSYIDLEI